MIKQSKPKPVAAGDRVVDVLARDESLIDVFVRSAPHFERLRDPEARRVMGRLATVPNSRWYRQWSDICHPEKLG